VPEPLPRLLVENCALPARAAIHATAGAARVRNRLVGLLLWFVMGLLAVLSPSLARAQQPVADTAAAASDNNARAPAPAHISVLNRRVATLRSNFLGISPADRARRAEEVIREELDKGGAGQVGSLDEPQGTVVTIDGAFAFLLTQADADALGGQTPQAQLRSTIAALEKAISETREARDRSRLLWAALHTLIATAVFALVAWGVLWLRRRMVRSMTRLLSAKTSEVKLAGLPMFHFSRVYEFSRSLVRLVAWLVLAVLTYEWLAYVLTRFPVTRPWGEHLGSFVVGVARRIGGGIVDALPDLCVALVIFAMARGVVLAVRPMFERIEQGRIHVGWLDADLAGPTRRIFEVVVWLFAVAMAYPYLPGSQSDAFRGISVLVGLMVTLGGSSLVGQAASGLILMYSRTVRVGEYVRIQEQEGTVVQLGTFTTTIRTGLGEEITLPNGVIMGAVTKNYSRAVKGKGYILDTVMTIGYDAPWRQVQAMMIEGANRTVGVLKDPEPRVFQTALSDYYVEYRLVCQAIPERPLPRAEVMAALHANLLDVFNEHGVQIMSPHYRTDPPDPKIVAKEDWYMAPARPPESGSPKTQTTTKSEPA
jgi:small-conductance mechanosensitive channel